MANRSAKKKTKKKQSARKKAASKSRMQANHSHWVQKLFIRLSIVILAIGGIYYFSSFEIRAKMERVALSAINSSRTHGAMPTLVGKPRLPQRCQASQSERSIEAGFHGIGIPRVGIPRSRDSTSRDSTSRDSASQVSSVC